MIDEITLISNSLNKSIKLSKTDYSSNIILEEADLGSVQGSHKTYKGINQIGETHQGTTINTRSVSIIGWIVGETEYQLQYHRNNLNLFINPLQPLTLLFKKYSLTVYPDSSVKYSTDYKENNEVMCKFMIQGTCTFPLFQDSESEKISVANTESKFMFPLCIPQDTGIQMGVRTPSLIALVSNKGAIPTGFTLIFKALGKVKNPSLTNIDTQEVFKINKEMVSGEVIVINMNDGEKSIKGFLNGVEKNYFRYKDFNSSWLKLNLGDNLFRYNADTNLSALEVEILHNNQYLEVQ